MTSFGQMVIAVVSFSVGLWAIIVGTLLIMSGINDCEYSFSGWIKILPGTVILLFAFFCCVTGIKLLDCKESYNGEYIEIIDRLESNPFDKETLHDAIVYNNKIELAKKLDDLGGENEYDQYLNEPIVDFDTYQIEYIEENFGFDSIIEKYESREN